MPAEPSVSLPRQRALTVESSDVQAFAEASLDRNPLHVDPLYARKNAKGMFIRLRKLTPEELKDVIEDLENVCEEKRDLDRQSRMHRALHAWLFVHLPLSFALIVLGFIHAVWALRY